MLYVKDMVLIEGPVSIISSNAPCNDDNARFRTVFFNLLVLIEEKNLQLFPFLNPIPAGGGSI